VHTCSRAVDNTSFGYCLLQFDHRLAELAALAVAGAGHEVLRAMAFVKDDTALKGFPPTPLRQQNHD